MINRSIKNVLNSPSTLLHIELIDYAFDKNFPKLKSGPPIPAERIKKIEELSGICPKVKEVINNIVKQADDLRIRTAEDYFSVVLLDTLDIEPLGQLQLHLKPKIANEVLEKIIEITDN